MKGLFTCYAKSQVIVLCILILSISTKAQLLPIPIDQFSFNEDIIAEGIGHDPVAVTSRAIGTKVFFDAGFRAANPVITAGGLPSTGIITDGSNVWQLNSYSTNNVVYYPPQTVVTQSSSKSLGLSASGRYSTISILTAAVNGPVSVGVVIQFTDGTATTLTNYTVDEWSAGSPFVISGVGLIERGPLADQTGAPTMPRLYQLDLPISVPDQSKNIDRIDVVDNDVSNSASLLFFAMSGVALVQLPVISYSLKGEYQAQNNVAVLSWQADGSLNTAGFEVERSPNGTAFHKIGSVKPGKSRGVSLYSFSDHEFEKTQAAYYRIKEILQDGSSNYSSIIVIKNLTLSSIKIGVSPGQIRLVTSAQQSPLFFKIVDLDGREWKSGTLSAANQFTVDIHSLAPGAYVIKLLNGTESKSLKFIKQQ